MDQGQFDVFLSAGAGLCAFGALLALLRWRSRGWAAGLMSLAFLVLGGILLMLKLSYPSADVIAAGVALAILLVAEFVIRATIQSDRGTSS